MLRPEFPKDISEEETNAGFALQNIHFGDGAPDFAVVLNAGKHRIVKVLTMSGEIQYALQLLRHVNVQRGGPFFTDAVLFSEIGMAVDWARMHAEGS